ncbi:uncharacterized protein LOC132061092 [Lycium ferocissimum]|uniref:uncharacterized protein LOC132061092 n=1 Tax=Lycium ferocissimum TaxID=112874 RepID=UPI002815A2CE|nr:uncharacterized protein LOC132061092 [Lycium ferocissimum]
MLAVLKTDPSSCPPGPLRSDPSTRDQPVWYQFHRTPGYETTDYRHLWEEVVNMLAMEYLREYLSERVRNNYGIAGPAKDKCALDASPHIINMIFGWSMIAETSFSASRKMKISVTWEKRTRDFLDEDLITFSDEDAVGVTLPHNDALVITVLIGCYQVKRVMVDPGSSANILRWKVVEEMGLLKKIIPAARTLAGFNMSSKTTKGEIDFPVEGGRVVKVTKFYVIDGDMRYNAIFRGLGSMI